MTPPGAFPTTFDLLVEPLVAALLVAYVLLAGRAAARFVRKQPLQALVALLMVGLALGVRLVVAPRLPMVAASADFDRLRLALACFEGPACWNPLTTDYPPGMSVLLTWIFRVTGVSVDVAFGVTTALGALTVLPAMSAARRVSGSAWGGVYAGLVLAVLPSAVIFSNGLNYVVPAAFCVTAALAHALAWLDDRRPIDAVLVGLAVGLFLLMRPEGALQAVPLAAVLVGALVAAGRHRALLDRGGLSVLACVAVPIALGAAVRVRGMIVGGGVPGVSVGALTSAVLTIAALAFAFVVAAPRVVRKMASGDRGVRWLLLGAGGALVAGGVVAFGQAGLGALAPAWSASVPLSVGAAPAATVPTYGAAGAGSLLTPWLFPIVFFVPLAVSWWPARSGAAPSSAVGVPAALAVVAAFTFVGYSLPPSGELFADGARYLVSATGALAIAVGVGAARLLATASAGRFAAPGRAAALAGAIAVGLVSPLATHARVLGDVDFDQQRQYLFLRRAVEALPKVADVLFADHEVALEGASERGQPVNFLTHSGQMLPALGLPGHTFISVTFRDFLRPSTRYPAPVFVFLGLDCYRTRSGDEDPTCRALRASPSLRRVASEVIPNRPYGRYPLAFVPEIELALFEVREGAEAAFRNELGRVVTP